MKLTLTFPFGPPPLIVPPVGLEEKKTSLQKLPPIINIMFSSILLNVPQFTHACTRTRTHMHTNAHTRTRKRTHAHGKEMGELLLDNSTERYTTTTEPNRTKVAKNPRDRIQGGFTSGFAYFRANMDARAGSSVNGVPLANADAAILPNMPFASQKPSRCAKRSSSELFGMMITPAQQQ